LNKLWQHIKYYNIAVDLIKWFIIARESIEDKEISSDEWDVLQKSLYKIVVEYQEG
jgi:hypothetical protein